jgi:hypothetical protein
MGGSTNRGGVSDLRSASYSPSRDGNSGRLSVKSPVVPLTPTGGMYAPHPLRDEPIDREDPYKIVRYGLNFDQPCPRSQKTNF